MHFFNSLVRLLIVCSETKHIIPAVWWKFNKMCLKLLQIQVNKNSRRYSSVKRKWKEEPNVSWQNYGGQNIEVQLKQCSLRVPSPINSLRQSCSTWKTPLFTFASDTPHLTVLRSLSFLCVVFSLFITAPKC